MLGAKFDTHFMDAYKQFKSIPDYKDSNSLAEECLIKYNKSVYERAIELSKSDNLRSLNQSIAFFKKIGDYKDSREIIKEVNATIKKIEEREKKDKQKRKKIGIIVGSLIAAVLIFIIILNSLIIPTSRYNEAVALYENEMYEEALDKFTRIYDFKDSREYIVEINNIIDYNYKEAIYINAEKLYDEGKYEQALHAFEQIKGFKSSDSYIITLGKEIIYEGAVNYFNQAKYDLAEVEFDKVLEFKESKTFLSQIKQKYISGFITSDNSFYFGKYPQTVVKDNTLINALNRVTRKNSSGYYEYKDNEYAKLTATPYKSYTQFNGGGWINEGEVYYFLVEPIKWKILESKNRELTILTDLVIDRQTFYKSTTRREIDGVEIYPNNYEFSDIRKWLNNEFYNKAFSANSKLKIKSTYIDNSLSTTNNNVDFYPVNSFYDKIFLLSYKEAEEKYFSRDSERKTKATDYALSRGVIDSYWWLRSWYWSSGQYNYYASDANIVRYNGSTSWMIVSFGEYGGVRPALKIDYNSQ